MLPNENLITDKLNDQNASIRLHLTGSILFIVEMGTCRIWVDQKYISSNIKKCSFFVYSFFFSCCAANSVGPISLKYIQYTICQGSYRFSGMAFVLKAVFKKSI